MRDPPDSNYGRAANPCNKSNINTIFDYNKKH